MPHPPAQNGAEAFFFDLCSKLTGRSALLPDTGDIGFTDSEYIVEESAFVSLYFSSSVPFILQKEECHFHFLENYYVHGLLIKYS